jgi:formimidoylglutamate deiminase
MTHHYRLQSALIGRDWTQDVHVAVGDDGLIQSVGAVEDTGSGAEHVNGYVVPGMPNAHSHAFQRGMVGDTEYRLSARDSFWTWRQAMYALANRITAADLEVLATQLFIEMLKSGYTSVAEFHYLHRAPDGTLAAGSNPLWDAATAAAEAAGIGFTFLPTLYQSSDFGSQPLRPDQGRFQLDTDRFLQAIEERVSAERRLGTPLRRTGAAFHSLRAVPLESLRQAVEGLQAIDSSMPVHIHIAEQIKEVEACREYTGRRPIELLLETGLMNRHWCLVHATHATPAELKGIAATSAAVCVSISTEANLGDGFFDAPRFLGGGGRLCIGSDSQATVCPAEELRWMEYQARLRKRRRSVLAAGSRSHVGTRLWHDAAEYGGGALGQPVGSIAVGSRADWLVLDPGHSSMVGSAPETALDRLLFAGGSGAIRDVMVAGRWVVKDRRHAAEAASLAAFRDLMGRLGQPSLNPIPKS